MGHVTSCTSIIYKIWRSCIEERMGRSNDRKIPVNNEEWCLGYSTQTRKQEWGIFEMDLKDKTHLNKRSHTRSREIWSSRRLHKNQQNIKAIFQLCIFYVWPCRPRIHQLWGRCTEEIMGWSNDGRIPVDNEELCLGYSFQTRTQECGMFEMDLQDKTCCWWKYWKVQRKICG